MPDESTGTIVIDASPSRILAVIADFEAYPQWVSEIKTAQISRSDSEGRPLRVVFTIDASIVKDRYELEYAWHGANGVSWHLIEGQMQKAQVGSYRLRLLDPSATTGPTEVTYALSVDTAIPVLGMLKRKAERVIVDTALKGLKKRVESIDE